MSLYSKIKLGDPVEALAIHNTFLHDGSENKVCLLYSSYRTGTSEPWTSPIVKHAEKEIANDDTIDKYYLPILGLETFNVAASQLILGELSPAILEQRILSIQTISAAGALYMIATFLFTTMDCRTVYNSKPTLDTFEFIFRTAGFEDFKTYRYWSNVNRCLNMEGLLRDLRMAKEKSVVILQVGCHNPTGCDPTHEEWSQIADVLEERKLLPVMYSGFQGLGSGDLDEDAWPVRYFVSRGMELICCQSFSKIFGLYNERIGNVTFVAKDESMIIKIKSQVSLITLGTYLTPPNHGARVVAYILNNPSLFNEWQNCLKIMVNHMMEIRKALEDIFQRLESLRNWNHISTQKGIYLYLGLSEHQCMYLIQHYHIYLLRNGRINITNINAGNMEYISNAIHDSITKFSKF